ncbi:PilZ domain-containing protein [sulfur-oxidizing endosymbiont of Gigantopelta aegis]|uniref:PilZ domain-containing protein n=1 Tax=sulfur-oxidizing endosymbiont of Gigantopelta aegis TaxID=2794934 RepID=UPI001FE2B84D|nr:PilZ domain-containing protein [sulfur-oxidizing endosymbiont of Gigantopelta aegis]
MIYQGKKFIVKSKNISINGLQVFLPRTFIESNQKVQISFDKFIENQNSLIGGVDQFTPYENIDYLIRDVKHLGEKTYLSLTQVNLSPVTKDFFKRFIAGNRLRYKIDATDRIFASKAQYYEKLYSVNMQHVPMFIHWQPEQGFYIDTLIKTAHNEDFFNYICDKEQKLQLDALCLPQRIEQFAKMAPENESAILFSYWENDKFHTVFDFELNTDKSAKDKLQAISQITNKLKSCQGRIYKILTNLNKKPVAEKVTAMLGKIQKIDAMASRIIDKRASESIAQVILVDITKIFTRQTLFFNDLEFKEGESLDLNVICEKQKLRMADGHLIEDYQQGELQLPDIVSFKIDHHRYDPRYQYEMRITVKFEEQKYAAKTIDFSRSGLGLVIQQEVNIPQDAIVEISFSSLMIKGIVTQLENISHRVMISRKTDEGLFLGLIRNTNLCHRSINQFFTKLVKRNKGKLELCIQDKVDTVNTLFFEAFVTENIQTIPVVLARDKNKQHYVREVGITQNPCPLAEKLYIDGQGYDFHFLTTELRRNEIHQRALKATDKNDQSFMLFLFLEEDEQGRKHFTSITDFEIINDAELEEFIRYTLQNKGLCIHIRFMNNLVVDTLYRNMTLDKVEQLNKASAKLLAQEYKDIIGFAEMLDLTDIYHQLYQYK